MARRRRALQRRVDGGALGDEENARRELVETADERRPLRGRPTTRPPEERVQDRAVRMSVGWVDDHAGGLIQRQQVVVLVQHVEADVLRVDDTAGRCGGQRDGHDVAKRRACRRATHRDAVDRDEPLLDPELDLRARGVRHVGEMPAEYEVETPAGIAPVGGENAGHLSRGAQRSATNY